MSKRGYYGTNKTGYGLIFLERMKFDEGEYVIGLGSPSRYPHYHEKAHEDNSLKMGSGFNKVKHNYIAHKNGFIIYKTAEERNIRLKQAKEEFEQFGYEVEITK